MTQPSLKEAGMAKKAAIFTDSTKELLRKALQIKEFNPTINKLEDLFKTQGFDLFENSESRREFADAFNEALSTKNTNELNVIRNQLLERSGGKLDLSSIDNTLKGFDQFAEIHSDLVQSFAEPTPSVSEPLQLLNLGAE